MLKNLTFEDSMIDKHVNKSIKEVLSFNKIVNVDIHTLHRLKKQLYTLCIVNTIRGTSPQTHIESIYIDKAFKVNKRNVNIGINEITELITLKYGLHFFNLGNNKMFLDVIIIKKQVIIVLEELK